MPRYPLIEFVLSIGTTDFEGEAYPDTGFEGGLSIPRGLAREIIAEPTLMPLRLADGSLIEVDCWDGYITLNEHRFHVEIVATGDGYLLGREVLDQMKICFEWGQRVRLEFRD